MSFVVEPFTFGEEVLRRVRQRKPFRIDGIRHLMATALQFQGQMADNPHISRADIGREAGITPGRARQVLRLANPHPELQRNILRLTQLEAKRQYPETLLRKLIVLSHDEQVERFARFRLEPID